MILYHLISAALLGVVSSTAPNCNAWTQAAQRIPTSGDSNVHMTCSALDSCAGVSCSGDMSRFERRFSADYCLSFVINTCRDAIEASVHINIPKLSTTNTTKIFRNNDNLQISTTEVPFSGHKTAVAWFLKVELSPAAQLKTKIRILLRGRIKILFAEYFPTSLQQELVAEQEVPALSCSPAMNDVMKAGAPATCAPGLPPRANTTTPPGGLGSCKANQLRCLYGACYDSVKHCDGAKDCQDGSDETNCSDMVYGSKCDATSAVVQCSANLVCVSSTGSAGLCTCLNGLKYNSVYKECQGYDNSKTQKPPTPTEKSPDKKPGSKTGLIAGAAVTAVVVLAAALLISVLMYRRGACRSRSLAYSDLHGPDDD